MRRSITLAALTAAALLAAGCTDQYGQTNPVATGAAAGTLLGAAAGQLAGGDTELTAVGALAGASAGIATGAVLEAQQQRRCAVYRGGVQVGTTPC